VELILEMIVSVFSCQLTRTLARYAWQSNFLVEGFGLCLTFQCIKCDTKHNTLSINDIFLFIGKTKVPVVA